MNAIQRFFFNIFLFCFGLGLFLFVKLDSYASASVELTWSQYNGANSYWSFVLEGSYPETGKRLALYLEPLDFPIYSGNSFQGYLFSNTETSYSFRRLDYFHSYSNGIWSTEYRGSHDTGDTFRSYVYNGNTLYRGVSFRPYNMDFVSNWIPIFYDMDSLSDYILNGTLPVPDFDETLELDSFKVTSWSIGNLQALFKSKFDVTWSDPRITLVQVRITGTANDVTYESSSSPFKGKFQADQFVFQKGDVIHLVATPYKADGSYGTSLYYSVTYSDNIPFSNNYRKMVNNNTNDNTLTIPYSGTSGNDSVTLPVDGVTTNVTYKVNYNPVTNEYGDLNLYEIYYSPVVVYPDNTSDQEVDDTQDEIINNYNTTNYYETTKNINLNFDIDFGDISSNDIGEGFNGVSGFFNGFGGFIGRLSNWILALFPFLPPIVANTIVFMFGLVIFIAGIALILKIIGAVGNIIDAILPL